MTEDWQAEQEERRNRIAAFEAKLLKWQRRVAALQAEREPPDLQKLVEMHGGWNEIPDEAWEHYHAHLRRWKTFMDFGDFYQRMQQLEQLRPTQE